MADFRATLEGLVASGAFTRVAAEQLLARMQQPFQGHGGALAAPRQPKPKKQRCVASRSVRRDCARGGEHDRRAPPLVRACGARLALARCACPRWLARAPSHRTARHRRGSRLRARRYARFPR